MALGKTALVLLVTMAIFGVAFGAVYRVGDSDGWSSRGLVDYNEWASTKDFHIGDTLIFAYNNQFHNVMQVTDQDFQSCNAISPIATYTSGSDTITLKRPGQFYFLCGSPGHCQAGQKVEIMVTLPIPDDSLTSPSPTAYGSSSPSSSHSEVMPSSPTPTLHPSKLVLAFTILVLSNAFGFVF